MAERTIEIEEWKLRFALKHLKAFEREWITVSLLIRVAAEGFKEAGQTRMGLELLAAFDAANERLPGTVDEERKGQAHG